MSAPFATATLARAALAALGALGALAVGELALRTLDPRPPSWLAVYAEHPRLPYALAPRVDARVDTGETDWRVRTDAKGLRIGAAGPVDPHAPHWLALGDSFAFGHGVDAELGLVERLSVELAVPIANAAVPGFGPLQYRLALEEHLDRPGLRAVVAFAFLGNDFHDALWDKHQPVHAGVLGARPGWKDRVRRGSHLYRALAAALHARGLGSSSWSRSLESELMDPDAWQSTLAGALPVWREQYAAMAAACAGRGLPFAVVVLPQRSAVDKDLCTDALTRRPVAGPQPRRAIESALALLHDLGIPTIDASPALEAVSPPRFLTFDGHLTAAANSELARALAESLRRRLDDPQTIRAAHPSSR